MANIKSAKKRAKQSEKARKNNVTLRSKLRTSIKKVRMAITAGNFEEAKQSYQAAQPYIDSMVNKKIIHKNAAARYKSRLNARIKQLANKS